MNVFYQRQGVEFEWDSNKAQSNLEKHGISFEEATEAFFDPFYQEGEATPKNIPTGHFSYQLSVISYQLSVISTSGCLRSIPQETQRLEILNKFFFHPLERGGFRPYFLVSNVNLF